MDAGLERGYDYGASMQVQRVPIKTGQGAIYRGEAIVWSTSDDISASPSRSMGGGMQTAKQDFVIKVPVTRGNNGTVQNSTSFMLTVPDGTIAGGNARGVGAIDLQYYRNAATKVASGTSAVALGGNNTASGTSAVTIGNGNSASYTNNIAIGTGNTAANHNTLGSICVGESNTCSGYGVLIGKSNNIAASNGGYCVGNGNTISGSGFVLGDTNTIAFGSTSNTAMGYGNSTGVNGGSGSTAIGMQNTSSATMSTAIGRSSTANSANGFATGYQSTTSGVIGKRVHATGQLTSVGDNQYAVYLFKQRTTDSTATVLTTNNAAAGSTNQIILANYSSFSFSGIIQAQKQYIPAYAKAWKIEGIIQRGTNPASTVLIASSITLIGESAGLSAATLALSADTTNGCLVITGTGIDATNLQWTGYVQCAESIYA